MSIKKAYSEIISYLEEHKEHKVKSILEAVTAMASAKAGGGGAATTFHRDGEGNVIAVRCFYFKKWMSPEDVEFGKKASSPTGLNSMCKAGVSAWTKQQRAAKAAKESLLTDVAAGEVEAADLGDALEAIEAARGEIIDLPEGIVGYDTIEAFLEA